MKLSALKIDSTRAEQGAWVDHIPDMGDLRLKVRDPRNMDARRLRMKLVGAVPRDRQKNGRIDPAEADRIDTRVLAEAILVDWSGLTDDDDAPLPYSREKAAEMLADPDLRPFRDAVAYAAGVVSEGAAEQGRDDVGNS